MAQMVAGKLTQLTDGVWRLLAPNPGVMTGPGTNSYLFGKTSLTLVDEGPAREAHLAALRAAVADIGMPLTHLICTHSHKDHSPAAAVLAQELGLPCWGAGVVDDPFQDRDWQPARVLTDNESVTLGGMKLKAIATPGHVSNHLCYLLEDCHWLFSGDHLINGSTVVIIPPAGSMSAYMHSLARLQQEHIDVIAPGHGDLIDQPAALIDGTLLHRKLREDKVMAALTSAPGSTAQELVPQVYQDVGSHLHALAALSLSAHLIKLGEEGHAREEAGRWFLQP
jgi:hydroxyacylglutathione hydrolase